MRGLERFVLRRADRIIAMSLSQREYLVKSFGISAEKIRVLWGPVDLDVFRYRDPDDSGSFRVGYSGNDFPWQGIEDCLSAATLLASDREIEFLFVTGSGWRTELKGLAGVVRFEGVTREDTAEHLARCHVLLSSRKGRAADVQYPFKLSSYLAVGRPVIATDVSDQRRILEEARCGVVVPPGSPEAIAEAVRRLRDEGWESRLEMGRRARRFAEEHLSLGRFHGALVSMYRGLGI
jgi:glycosyltransferase involved in cell wall biosynthesis